MQDSGLTRNRLARRFGVGANRIQRARDVLLADPVAAARVKAGEIPLRDAYDKFKRLEHQRDRLRRELARREPVHHEPHPVGMAKISPLDTADDLARVCSWLVRSVLAELADAGRVVHGALELAAEVYGPAGRDRVATQRGTMAQEAQSYIDRINREPPWAWTTPPPPAPEPREVGWTRARLEKRARDARERAEQSPETLEPRVRYAVRQAGGDPKALSYEQRLRAEGAGEALPDLSGEALGQYVLTGRVDATPRRQLPATRRR